jgi:hypothetical protein
MLAFQVPPLGAIFIKYLNPSVGFAGKINDLAVLLTD